MKKQKGVTIIELTLYMGLLSIFLLIFTRLMTSVIDTQTTSSSTSLIHTSANFLISKLTTDINQADYILEPLSIGSSSSSLRLVNTDTGTTNTYSIDNSRLVLANNTGVSPLNDIDTSINNFTVTRLGNHNGENVLSIGFTIISNLKDGKDSKNISIQTTVGTR